jgi:hypothetical protein
VDRDRLVGRWRIVSYELRRAGEDTIEPYGRDPVGVLSYGADGRMSVLFGRRGRAPFSGPDYLAAAEAEKAAAFDGFAAYAGTWALDEAARVVVHRVEIAWVPSWEGSEQRRSYALAGSTLELSSDKGWSSSRLVWRRLSSPG